MEKIQWISRPASVEVPCVLCGNTTGNMVVLRALHWQPTRGYLDLALCGACGSGFYVDASAHAEYPSDATQLDNPEFWLLVDHYLELVSGLEWKIPLLERLPFERFKSVLELGCNLGVAIDYCRTAWNADAVGLEPSAYGAAGRKVLGLPIFSQTLREAPGVASKRYDLVFATEVLEHVADPADLIAQMKEVLTPAGVLLVTTPRAEDVTRAARPGDLYATLSAGAHRFIPSKRALETLLRSAGFEFVHFDVTGNSQVFYASRSRFELREKVETHRRRADYYRRKLNVPNASDRVQLGDAINAYDALTRIGARHELPGLQPRIESLLQRTFAISTDDLMAIVQKLAATSNIFEFGRRVPYGLPLYLRAKAINATRTRDAAAYRAATTAICAQGLRCDFQNLFAYHWMYDDARDALARSPVSTMTSLRAVKLFAAALTCAAAVPELSHKWERLVAAGVRSLRPT